MACGCSKKRRATALGQSASTRSAPAGFAPTQRMKISWISNPPVGVFLDPVEFSTVYECRSWARANPGWTVETVKVPIPT